MKSRLFWLVLLAVSTQFALCWGVFADARSPRTLSSRDVGGRLESDGDFVAKSPTVGRQPVFRAAGPLVLANVINRRATRPRSMQSIHSTYRHRRPHRIDHRAPRTTTLVRRVNDTLRADRRLNGACAYPDAHGGVVLYGEVFDEPARQLAERTANNVRGVQYVINRLKTSTGEWLDQQVRINDALLKVDALHGVSAKVVGSQAYLSGQVRKESDKNRAAQIVSSFSNLEVINNIWVVPGPIFSMPWFE